MSVVMNSVTSTVTRVHETVPVYSAEYSYDSNDEYEPGHSDEYSDEYSREASEGQQLEKG